MIQANAEYVFVEGDIKSPSAFLSQILTVSGLSGGWSSAWILAIIIPCSIAVILVPCWIILCVSASLLQIQLKAVSDEQKGEIKNEITY